MHTPVILLVEDSPSDEALALAALEKARIANPVLVVHDGQEALDYLFGRNAYAGRDVSDAPEVVLLDLNLPKVTGLEVLRAVRADARTHDLPIVILTSSREDRDIVDGYSLGANSYIVKPVDPQQFADAVQALGLFWLVLRRPAALPG